MRTKQPAGAACQTGALKGVLNTAHCMHHMKRCSYSAGALSSRKDKVIDFWTRFDRLLADNVVIDSSMYCKIVLQHVIQGDYHACSKIAKRSKGRN